MAQIMYRQNGGGAMPFPSTAPTDIPASRPSRAESLAAALELQRVGEGANQWVAHVLGVHNDGRHLWAQIAARPDGTQNVVLRLSLWATPRHALATLATLPCESLGSSAVVPVMCTV
jgi:hypothetical protein